MAEKVVSIDGRQVPASQLVYGFMSSAGVGINAVGDYSDLGAGAKVFKYTADKGSLKLHITSVTIFIEDAGNFGSDVYGVNITLLNGILMGFYDVDDSVLLESSGTVNTNTDWAALTGNFTQHIFQGTGNNSATTVFEFTDDTALAVLSLGQYHAFTLNDDFTGLVKHTFAIRGYYA